MAGGFEGLLRGALEDAVPITECRRCRRIDCAGASLDIIVEWPEVIAVQIVHMIGAIARVPIPTEFQASGRRYILAGAVVFRGRNHYAAIVQSSVGQWLQYNDDRVSKSGNFMNVATASGDTWLVDQICMAIFEAR
jgi:hypothetical protein